MKKVGYSYWGFLGDKKYDEIGNEVSTPDGNAFYSWSIIHSLQKRGYEVIKIMPDRDANGINAGNCIFNSWSSEKRRLANSRCKTLAYDKKIDILKINDFFKLFDDELGDCEFIIHEWRMVIPGRNSFLDYGKENWQPDLFLQDVLLKWADVRKKKIYIFDLDYKLSLEDARELPEKSIIIELGNKWLKNEEFSNKSKKVYIPFLFSDINQFFISEETEQGLVYVGNDYERTWCIDKYFKTIQDAKVYGKWPEQSEKKYKNIKFMGRIQTSEMRSAYGNSACTILLAKKEYVENGFMTARIVEAIFYGTVPLFIEEYGKSAIKNFAGKYSEVLTVRNSEDVRRKTKMLKENPRTKVAIVKYLRKHLVKMDSANFVETLIQGGK